MTTAALIGLFVLIRRARTRRAARESRIARLEKAVEDLDRRIQAIR